jgi:hypothetical protein
LKIRYPVRVTFGGVKLQALPSDLVMTEMEDTRRHEAFLEYPSSLVDRCLIYNIFPPRHVKDCAASQVAVDLLGETPAQRRNVCLGIGR